VLILKAMIYATSSKGLLVFEEPAHPHIGLQVPGGTIEAGEERSAAACREFHEETGLQAATVPRLLGSIDFDWQEAGQTYRLRRYYFQINVDDYCPDAWDHYEMYPSSGGEPILFHLFWLPLDQAHKRLDHGMAELLHHVS